MNPHSEYIAQLARHLSVMPPRHIPSEKRASVAIIVRMAADSPHPRWIPPAADSPAAFVQAIETFLRMAELARSTAQVLFMQRALYDGDPWSGHIGFPGGKREPLDASDRQTAEREVLEEIGVDLPKTCVCLGQLDDACAYTLFGTRMVSVSPFVYLQVSPLEPRLSDEVESLHWIDFGQLVRPVLDPAYRHRTVSLSIADRVLPPRLAGVWLGEMHYTMLPLRYTSECSLVKGRARQSRFVTRSELHLWGLSLAILSSLVDLSLVSAPRAYASIASPWPQMDLLAWADANLVVNAIHAWTYAPRKRKPWVVVNKSYFEAYFGAYRWALGVACAVRAVTAWAAWRAVRWAVRRAL